MKVRIIADSTSDLIPEVKERVRVVPLTVHFGQEEYIDGVTIDHRTFYEKLIESDVLPTTSQASPAAFAEVFATAVEEGYEVVALTVSGKLVPGDVIVKNFMGTGADHGCMQMGLIQIRILFPIHRCTSVLFRHYNPQCAIVQASFGA